MKGSEKKLKKALAYYEKGNYEEALKLCEKVLEKEYHNETALTIEGNSLYNLGRADEAIVNWKINYEFNNNQEAKEYLRNIDKEVKEKALNFDTIVGTKSDIENIRKEIQNELNKANLENDENLLKELQDKAKKRELSKKENNVPNFEEHENTATTEADELIDDSINISKSLDPKKVEEGNKALEEELKIGQSIRLSEEAKDAKNNSEAIKSMREYDEAVKNLNKRKSFKLPIIVACSAAIIIGAYALINKNSSEKSTTNKTTVTENNQSTENNTEAPKDITAELKAAIDSNNINDLYNILSVTSKDKVTGEENIKVYDSALNLMKSKGVEEFYNDGYKEFTNKNYDKALDYFNKAYNFANDSYLKADLIYFLASTNAELKNKDEAIKYYEQYLNDYPNGKLHTAECLYNLATYYNENGNKEKAKKYAQEIEDKYPSSQYYDQTIINIIFK